MATGLLLLLFSIGIALGSLLCETLARGREIGLASLGAIGMTLFSVDMCYAVRALPPAIPSLAGVAVFIAQAGHWRVMGDLVPAVGSCRALQCAAVRANPIAYTNLSHHSRIIAANNVLNTIYMVVSPLCTVVTRARRVK